LGIPKPPPKSCKADYLLSDVIGIPPDRQNDSHTKCLAAVMRRLGWTLSLTPLRFGKDVKRGYTKSGGT
jgi:hypothetical protein